jgi:hypothetical protein
MLHVLDHHFRHGQGHPEHKELVIDVYTCIERLATEYALCRHKDIVSLKEKLLLVILDRRLGTYGGEKKRIIWCRRIRH